MTNRVGAVKNASPERGKGPEQEAPRAGTLGPHARWGPAAISPDNRVERPGGEGTAPEPCEGGGAFSAGGRASDPHGGGGRAPPKGRPIPREAGPQWRKKGGPCAGRPGAASTDGSGPLRWPSREGCPPECPLRGAEGGRAPPGLVSTRSGWR